MTYEFWKWVQKIEYADNPKEYVIRAVITWNTVCFILFLSSKIVTPSPKDQVKRFYQEIRPLLKEWGLAELYQSRT